MSIGRVVTRTAAVQLGRDRGVELARMGEPKDPQFGTEAGPVGKLKSKLTA